MPFSLIQIPCETSPSSSSSCREAKAVREREEAWFNIEKLALQNPQLQKLTSPELVTTKFALPKEEIVEHVTDLSKVSLPPFFSDLLHQSLH